MSIETKFPVTHVIFDFDGTLVNTHNVMINIFRDFAESYGKKLSPEIEESMLNGLSINKEFIESLGMSNEINIKDFRKQTTERYYECDFELIPGVDKVIKNLHKNNIPMAIATNNLKQHIVNISQKFGNYFDAGNYFSHICCRDDEEVLHPKPDPDVYFVCAKRFESQPKDLKNVLIIEDSLTGIEGAVASGMQTLLVRDKRMGEVENENNRISAVINSFKDLKPETFGLPAYKN